MLTLFNILLTTQVSVLTFDFTAISCVYIMQCDKCDRFFATKYTYRRHLDKKHPIIGTSTTSEDYIDDSSESIMSTEDPSHPESNASDDKDDDDNGTEPSEPDFWSLLIEETAEKIHNDRLGAGFPGPMQEIRNLNQFAHGMWFSLIIKHMQNRYKKSKKFRMLPMMIPYWE